MFQGKRLSTARLCATRFHQVFARRTAQVIATAAVLGLLTGCQNIAGNTSSAQLRIITASPDAPGLDIYANNSAIAYNLGFGTITSYIPIDAATYTITADSAGTKQILSSSKVSLVDSSQYTDLIGNSSATLQQLILKDQSQAAPSGQISLRFVDQATRIGAVDIYLIPSGQKLVNVAPLVTNISFGINTGYLNIPTGAYSIVMVPTGTVPTSTTTATYAGPLVTYSGGSATTIVLIDQQLITTPGLQVIMAPDFIPPTGSAPTM
jgi:Domain of unknown function (DUF4397)